MWLFLNDTVFFILGIEVYSAVAVTATHFEKVKCKCSLFMHYCLISKIDHGQSWNYIIFWEKSISFIKSGLSVCTRMPDVSMMNYSVKALTCYVQITRTVSSLSVWRRYKFVRKKGPVQNVFGSVDWCWVYFFFLEKRREQKVLKGISFSWQQLLRTELAFQMTFQRCRRHSTKSSWSYRNGLCRKNKHLVEEEQSSEKKEP